MYRTTKELIADLEDLKRSVGLQTGTDSQSVCDIERIIAQLTECKEQWQIRSELEGYEETWNAADSLEDAQAKLKQLYIEDLAEVQLTPEYSGDDAWLHDYDSHISIAINDCCAAYADRHIEHKCVRSVLSPAIHFDNSFRE